MQSTGKNALKLLLRGVSWLLLAIAALVFLIGGQMFDAFAQTGRTLGEIFGIGISVLVGGLSHIAKSAADNFDDDEEGSESQTDRVENGAG